MLEFKTGDIVEWSSTSRGSTKTKRGVIVAIVPKKAPEYQIEKRYREEHPKYKRMSDGGGRPRDHESYLVLVPGPNTTLPSLYWPVVAKLALVMDVPKLKRVDK